MCAAIPDSSATTPPSGSSTASAKTASTPRVSSPLRTGMASAARRPDRRAASTEPARSGTHTGPPRCHASPASPLPRVRWSGTGSRPARPGALQWAAGRSAPARSSTSHSSACGQPRVPATAASTRGPASGSVGASASAVATASSPARNRSVRRRDVMSCSAVTAPSCPPSGPVIGWLSTSSRRRRPSGPTRSSSASRTRSPSSARRSGTSSVASTDPSGCRSVIRRAQPATSAPGGGSPTSRRSAALVSVIRPAWSHAATPTCRLSRIASRNRRCRSTSCRACCLATSAVHAWAAWSTARISSAVHTRGRKSMTEQTPTARSSWPYTGKPR